MNRVLRVIACLAPTGCYSYRLAPKSRHTRQPLLIRTSFNLALAAGLVAVAMSCATEPEPRLRISGTVQSAATGAPIAGALVELWFGTYFSPDRVLRDTTTDSSGRFVLEIGPPPGYSFPNCSTLHLEVKAVGFMLGLSGVGGCPAGAWDTTILLTPLWTPPG